MTSAPGPVRRELLGGLAADLARHDPGHPLRVGVDGITAAGKTTFSTELVAALVARGRPARQVSTDDHHHVAEHRRRDPDRARGYYRDAFDLAGFREQVLDPLGPAGDRWVRPRRHDLVTDAVVDEPPVEIAAGTVVVVDGTFLQVPALDGGWDVVIWLDVPFAVAEDRAAVRDAALLGGESAARAAYAARYHAACRLYLDDVDAARRATYVVDNADPGEPRMLRRPQ